MGNGYARWVPNYSALTKHLEQLAGAEVTMSFLELDRVVGGLPASARKHAAWWANTTTSHSHARAWLDARFSASPDFVAGRVRFNRGVPARRTQTTHRAPPRAIGSPAGASEWLQPTGEEVGAKISYGWCGAGAVALAGGKLAMPTLGARPGIYRFVISDGQTGAVRHYVGESSNLASRMNGYRNPGPTQHTNIRLNTLLLSTLKAGGTVDASVVLEANFAGQALELGSKSARLLVESAALLVARSAGIAVENLKTGSSD